MKTLLTKIASKAAGKLVTVLVSGGVWAHFVHGMLDNTQAPLLSPVVREIIADSVPLILAWLVQSPLVSKK